MAMNISGWGECCNKLVFHNAYAVEHLGWSINLARTYVFSNISIPNYLFWHEETNGRGQWTVKRIDKLVVVYSKRLYQYYSFDYH